MKHTHTVTCIYLRSPWQAIFLRSALSAILLAPLAALHAADNAHVSALWSDDFSDAAVFAVN
jgi:uncharacterized MnhB-related membrane protein